jgi:quercetin dioxygenase-like cupin family protein
MTARELFIGSADGTKHQVVGDTMRVLAKGGDTGGAFEIFEMTAPRDSGPPAHAHPWTESYSVIEGTVDILIGDRTIAGNPGCFVQIPAGTFHSYRITSDIARVIIVTSPSGAADFFSEVDRETDFEKIVGIALKHGFTLPAAPAQ